VEDATFDNVQTSFPLVCMNATAVGPEAVAHFRNLAINGKRPNRNVVDIQPGESGLSGDSPHSPTCYFHDLPRPGTTLQVVSTRFGELLEAGEYREVDEITGPLVRATETKGVAFPALLAPVDDLPPATMILSAQRAGKQVRLRGVAHDNGEIDSVQVNGRAARITARHAGLVEWEATIDAPADRRIAARSIDSQGNAESHGHVWAEN
jgi:hypothetical protein